MGDCGRDCGCRSDVTRRDFLKVGAGTAGLLYGTRSGQAAPGDIPPACRARPPREWFDRLTQAGEPIVYSGSHLENLIFPLGGIGTGTIWLHGSGRLVNWQIFNNIQKDSLVDDTFFAVRVQQEGGPPVIRVLRQQSAGPFAGIHDVRFLGQYPVAKLTFRDPEMPGEIELEAFNPMIPLNERESGIPCAIFTVRVANDTDRPVAVSLLGSLQNAVGHAGKGASAGTQHGTYGGNVNRAIVEAGLTAVSMSAEPGKPAEFNPPVELVIDHSDLPRIEESPVRGLTLNGPGRPMTSAGVSRMYWLGRGDLKQLGGSILLEVAQAVRARGATLLLSGVDNPLVRPARPSVDEKERRRETVLASFDDASWGQWEAKGHAFRGPSGGTSPAQNPVSGFLGAGLVNTFDPNDQPKGTLTSPEFVIRERYISLLVGGGQHPGACCVNLLVDGKVVRTATGRNSEHLERVEWDVSEFANREARIQIVDSKSNPWGHILADDIRLGNLPIDAVTAEEAEAWNALLNEVSQADVMTPVGVGRGRAMLIPVELGSAREGVDPTSQRDKMLAMVAGLAGVEYRPQVGRPGNAPSFGTMCLATSEAAASFDVGWTDHDPLYRLLSDSGRLMTTKPRGSEVLSAGPTGPGETMNAALCVEAMAPAGGTAQATFVLTWHFPNQYYPQNSYRMAGNTAVEVGNMYANWYTDAMGVARHVLANCDRLRGQTLALRDAMFDTTLPQYFIDAVSANASIIRSPTCFWTKDGTFFGFEGCVPSGGGCCPMNCNHVWNYEQALAWLWPALERDMRKTELVFHQRQDGGTHHRVTVPRDFPKKHAPPVADGQCGAVLKAYREHLQSADRRFLDDYWERIVKAMDFAIAEWDPDHDGVMEKPQFNTYDRVIYGHNTFVSSLYLAGLRAAEEMALLRRDERAAKRYRELFERGRDKIAGTLFDGEYYIQKADNIDLGYGTGCWSDQVVGQWWARILDLGDILPAEQVRSALKAIFKHNFLWKIEGFEGTQRFLQFADGDDKGLLCGSWPRGGRPEDPILYRDECWTGVEYQVAAHKIYEGQIEEGLAIVKGARERYDGTKRSPWNEIECGDYYARALSSWSLLLAAQGCAYDGPARKLTFDPRLMPGDHRSLFTTAEGWGRFEQKRAGRTQTVRLAFLGGRCDLKELRLGVPAEAKTVSGTVRLDDRDVVAETALEGSFARVRLGSAVTAGKGETLHIELGWT